MPVCPSCNREVLETARFCPECGAALPRSAPRPAPGVTAAETIPESPPSRHPSSGSSIHGRFEPGTRLGARYRIVGLLGRGGMGEVYRADDLELGQSVALKFLPEKVSRNAADLARLRSEVRTARQVAHPNVCRTYDISEAEGQVFVVMEYIDGEDLSSVLRRLGRPSPDKALEIARQLCLGLGAAHENGVLHRDLKPANIMIDGRGRARITDFGLAGTAAEIAAEGVVAGTPAYMAPEQLRSGVASVPSDIYALGLVLYEIFTGKRAYDMTPRPEPARGRGAEPGSGSSVRTPSSFVADVDPAVERVILRCLEPDPARRPQSAYAVFGALPGGDPLAAAVAAGETPSPELVANAGVEGSVRPLFAGIAVAAAILGFLAISFLQRPLYAGFDRPANVLSVRAEEILTQASGRSAPRYSDHGYRYEPTRKDSAAAAASHRRRFQRESSKHFWRRWSPVPLATTNVHAAGAMIDDPPQTYPGSGTVVMDAGTGRLIGLRLVPEAAKDTSKALGIDWSMVLRAAGVDPPRAIPVPKPAAFASHADTVAAWRLSPPGAPETTIVAAALRGRIVEVETYAGETGLADLAVRGDRRNPSLQDWGWVLIIIVLPLVGSIVLATRNVRAGRGDVRGSLVIGIFVTVVYLVEHVLAMRPTELGLFEVLLQLSWQAPLGHALIHGVTIAVAYLAVEPYVRRLWPSVLVSWARIVAGRLRDPIVGRDILIGLAYGAFFQLLTVVATHLSRQMGLVSEPIVAGAPQLDALLGPRDVLEWSSLALAVAIVRTTIFLTVLLILRFILRGNLAAGIAAAVLYTALVLDFTQPVAWPMVVAVFLTMATGVVVILRFGFVAALVGLWAVDLASSLPWTIDFGGWIGPQTAFSWAIVGALLAYGFATAVAGHSLFQDPLSEPRRGPARSAGP